MKVLHALITSLFLFTACATHKSKPADDFVEPDPETYVNLNTIIQEYFYLRKQAVLSGEMAAFYQRYPDLAVGTDLELGINMEAHLVESMHKFDPIDGNIFPQYYERLKIQEIGWEIHALLHGMELYSWQDKDGTYQESGGEFKTVLLLRQKEETWQVIGTDEVTLEEFKNTN
jgi:hypothetical protein